MVPVLPHWRVLVITVLLLLALPSQAAPRHYVFFNRDRDRITDRAFLDTKAFEGAQVKYTWRELEPRADQYDFNAIRNDLRVLKENGKRLFIQLQDTSFDPQIVLVPRYLVDDSRYHGGVDKQYNIPNDDESKATPQGWVARRWDRAVRERFHKLLNALGKEFDGQIEGLNLPETAVDFGEGGRLFPSGFTVDGYRDAILDNLLALKRAFPKSVVMQYANFMPGEWLPGADHGYLRSVYRNARDLKVGLGAPDLLPYRPAQMAHAYPLLRESAGLVPTGIAVQWGNYEATNPKTGKRVTIAELSDFATTYLKSDYVFWCMQETFFARDVIPFMRGEQARVPVTGR